MLGCSVLALVALLALPAGCGGSDEESRPAPPPKPKQSSLSSYVREADRVCLEGRADGQRRLGALRAGSVGFKQCGSEFGSRAG